MPQLHENLAVEASLGKAAEKLLKESQKNLGKENLFRGYVKTLSMFDAERENVNLTDEVLLTSTVDENLNYLIAPVSNHWDALLQKDLTNQNAKADIIIDGVLIASDLPATFLLSMESKLGILRSVYDSIHTLPPGFNWQVDDTGEKVGVYKVMDTDTFKTEKAIEFVEVSPATKEHPAQVREVSKNNTIGRYKTEHRSGLLTPIDKAMRLKRIDKLIYAVKQARQRANQAELVNRHVGAELFDYINNI